MPRDRLLEDFHAYVDHPFSQVDCRLRIIGLVRVDLNEDFVTDRLSHR